MLFPSTWRGDGENRRCENQIRMTYSPKSTWFFFLNTRDVYTQRSLALTACRVDEWDNCTHLFSESFWYEFWFLGGSGLNLKTVKIRLCRGNAWRPQQWQAGHRFIWNVKLNRVFHWCMGGDISYELRSLSPLPLQPPLHILLPLDHIREEEKSL